MRTFIQLTEFVSGVLHAFTLKLTAYPINVLHVLVLNSKVPYSFCFFLAFLLVYKLRYTTLQLILSINNNEFRSRNFYSLFFKLCFLYYHFSMCSTRVSTIQRSLKTECFDTCREFGLSLTRYNILISSALSGSFPIYDPFFTIFANKNVQQNESIMFTSIVARIDAA